jgi:hypothetical protein
MNTSVYIFQQRAQVNRWLSLKSNNACSEPVYKRELHILSSRVQSAWSPARASLAVATAPHFAAPRENRVPRVANIMVTKSRQACLLSYYVLYQLQRRVMNIFHAPGYCYSGRFLRCV